MCPFPTVFLSVERIKQRFACRDRLLFTRGKPNATHN
jgi:hypothetical protein